VKLLAYKNIVPGFWPTLYVSCCKFSTGDMLHVHVQILIWPFYTHKISFQLQVL